MNILAFDIGKRRTGVAFLDQSTGVPVPLVTLTHSSDESLIDQLVALISQRKADRIIVGLPRLPSGEEGSQAEYVRDIVTLLQDHGIQPELVDERYTNDPNNRSDPDAYAAWNLLQSAPQFHQKSS